MKSASELARLALRLGSRLPRFIRCRLRLFQFRRSLGRTAPPNISGIRLGLVLVGFGLTGEAVARVERLARNLERRGAAVERVIVENGTPREAPIKEGWQVVDGSNRRFEFSGYEEGVAALKRSHDFVILLNDRWESSKALMIPLAIERLPFRSMIDERAIIGHVNRYPLPVTVLGAPSASWIRTHAVVLPFGVLAELRPLDLGEFDLDATISDSHRAMIDAYVKGTGPMSETYTARWYRADSDIEAGTYLRKEVSIFLEHALSVRAKEQGIAMLDLWARSALPPRP